MSKIEKIISPLQARHIEEPSVGDISTISPSSMPNATTENNTINIKEELNDIIDALIISYKEYLLIADVFIKRANMLNEKIDISNIPDDILRHLGLSNKKELSPNEYIKILQAYINTLTINTVNKKKNPHVPYLEDFINKVNKNLPTEVENAVNMILKASNIGSTVSGIQTAISTNKIQKNSFWDSVLKSCCPCTIPTFDNIISSINNVAITKILSTLWDHVLNVLTDVINNKLALLSGIEYSRYICYMVNIFIYNAYNNKCLPNLVAFLLYLKTLISNITKLVNSLKIKDILQSVINLPIRVVLQASLSFAMSELMSLFFPFFTFFDCMLKCSEQELNKVLPAIDEAGREIVKYIQSDKGDISNPIHTSEFLSYIDNKRKDIKDFNSYLMAQSAQWSAIVSSKINKFMEEWTTKLELVIHELTGGYVTDNDFMNNIISLKEAIKFYAALIQALKEAYTYIKLHSGKKMNKMNITDFYNAICRTASLSSMPWIQVEKIDNDIKIDPILKEAIGQLNEIRKKKNNEDSLNNDNTGNNNSDSNNDSLNGDNPEESKIIIKDSSIAKLLEDSLLDKALKNNLINIILSKSYLEDIEMKNSNLNKLSNLYLEIIDTLQIINTTQEFNTVIAGDKFITRCNSNLYRLYDILQWQENS